MVEYVLGGSPTNKESPLSGLEPRLRALKFDDNDKVSCLTPWLNSNSALVIVFLRTSTCEFFSVTYTCEAVFYFVYLSLSLKHVLGLAYRSCTDLSCR